MNILMLMYQNRNFFSIESIYFGAFLNMLMLLQIENEDMTNTTADKLMVVNLMIVL